MPAISPRNPVPDPKQGADARRMAARLERAVDTLARLPRDSGTLPAGVRSAWPEMIRGSWFAVSQTRCESRARPAPDAIDDLDRVARLLWRVEPHQRRLLWARACGVRWAERAAARAGADDADTRSPSGAAALVAAEIAPDRAETPGLPGKTARHSVQNRIFPIIRCPKYPLHHDDPFPMTLWDNEIIGIFTLSRQREARVNRVFDGEINECGSDEWLQRKSDLLLGSIRGTGHLCIKRQPHW